MTKLHKLLQEHFPSGYVGGDVKVKLNLDYTFTRQFVLPGGTIERIDTTFRANEKLCVVEWTDSGPSIHRNGESNRYIAQWGMIREFICIRKN